MRQRNNAIAIVCLAYATLLPVSVVALQSASAQAVDSPKVVTEVTATQPAVPTVAKERNQKASRQSRPVNMIVKLKGRRTITSMELYKLLADVGFTGRGHKIAYALVMRESRGHARSHNTNPETGDNSYGLFQINMIGRLGPHRRAVFNLDSNDQLLDPVINAKAAYYMSRGQDFSSWGLGATPYRSGRGEDTISGWYDDYERIKAKVMKENQ